MHVASFREGGANTALSRFVSVARDKERVLIGDNGPDVGRVFMVCRTCGVVRPMYRIAEKREFYCRKCGATDMRPARINSLRAAWWVLIVGGLWRRVIRRKREQRLWDPRMSVRFREPKY